MAKTIYITNEQYNSLKKLMTEAEDNKMLEIPIVPDDPTKKLSSTELGTQIIDKTKAIKNAGVKNAEVTVNRNIVACSKQYSKKQIEEAKLNKVLNNSKSYTKTDFQKKFF